MARTKTMPWAAPGGAVADEIAELNERCLNAYKANPALVEEHANAERIQTEGGYGRRQIWELIQNGADEMLGSPGRVEVVLTEDHLYCADQGGGITPEGAGAILSAYRSAKRGPEIGRFGLGFKSVLGVSETPEFFSRPGSFGFDPAYSRDRIREVLKKVSDVPTLRLARTLDPEAARASDPTLATLMEWATTVVRLPLAADKGEWLPADLEGFEAQFLVFSPHIAELVLDDRRNGRRREIRLADGATKFEHRLLEGDTEDVWRVFSADFRPSDAAAKDGGAMAHREVIRLQWAVPVRSRGRVGGLWAYFPTLEDTTLSGVINAPWKLNDDRTRVIEGPFNREILDRAADLVLANLEVLVAKDDPANVLDILPARGREERNWADGFLTERLNTDAPSHPSVPDQTGRLNLPSHMTLHPAKLPQDALDLWSKVPGRPESWAHPSVERTQTRRARAERFFDAATTNAERRATVTRWLQALIPAPANGDPIDLRASGFALLVAAEAIQAPDVREEVLAAKIVVDQDGALVSAAEVLLPGEREVAAPGIRLVHRALAKSKKARAALVALGVEEIDAELELRALLKDRRPGQIDQDWDTIWEVAGRTEANKAYAALEEAGFTGDTLRVRVMSGKYLPVVATLLPGDVVRTDPNPDVVIDVAHHEQQLRLLRLLGAVSAPSAGAARETEPAMREFRQAAVDDFIAKNPRSKPNRERVVLSPGSVAGPLTPLESLQGAARARYTAALLDAQPSFLRCDVSYPGNAYRSISVEHPVLWAIRRHGLAETTAGLVGPDQWVGPDLRPWRALLPVANIAPAAAEALQIPRSLEALSEEQWTEAYGRAVANDDGALAARFYCAACAAGGPRPEKVLADVAGEIRAVDLDDLRVTGSGRTAAVLRKGGCPLLELGADDVELLIERWGVARGDDEVASEVVAVEEGPRVALVDLFPAIRLRLDDAQRDLEVARCSDVRIEVSGAGGRETEPTQFHVEGTVVYVDEQLSEHDVLNHLSRRLGLGLDAAAIDKIIENKQNQEIRARIKELRARKTDAEKLAVVVGTDDLKAALPAPLLKAAEQLNGAADAVELARLAFAVYGVETLKTFSESFEQLGLQPPRMWSGSRPAVEFVRNLGFGREHAGFPGASRDSTLEIDGPPRLNELHPYQQAVVDEIHKLLRMDPKVDRPRGMVSLPTGAGKTRVAIQALVEAMRSGELGSPVLWVAQRDELCEQAVQAWSEVWRDRGPQERLTISRLWSTNEAEAAPEGMQVVVATISKLDSRVMTSKSYDWLSEATCIVIDEAHLALPASYTRLLEWQGMDRQKERVPLIGLTATPYRGVSEDDTKRLVNRFGKRRLDQAAFGDSEPYQELQAMGVLSRVQHRTLKGSSMVLNDKEIAEIQRTRLLPSSAEDRLGADVDRNQGLLAALLEHPDDWTSLVFCTSIEHAKVMAGLLTSKGVPAACVSGATPHSARRHYIEEFRAGRLRVLTNYAVFAEGFDAPKVRAVYVARPTYSPNVYQQMVGRGLRGPKNGGSEECLIVNVEDTFENFGEELAFRQFEHLWDPDGHEGEADGDR